MFELIKTEGSARRGVFTCALVTVQTPVFMNVGTQGGHQRSPSAPRICRTLAARWSCPTHTTCTCGPGTGLSGRWGAPSLYDPGTGLFSQIPAGFRYFLWPPYGKLRRKGCILPPTLTAVRFLWGRRRVCKIQSNLGSDICMAFDECIENPAPRDYVHRSVDRTYRWLERCKAENARLNQLPDAVNPIRCFGASTREGPMGTFAWSI